MNRCARLSLLLWLLASTPALAVTYTFNTSGGTPVSGTPSICSGNWTRSGTGASSVFTCNGSISTANGDVLRVSSNASVEVVATASITLRGSSVGSATRGISLRTDWGDITSTATSTVYGSLSSNSGTLDLSGTRVTGAVTSNGRVELSDSQVDGDVSGRIGVTSSNSQIGGTLTAQNGSISLSGGSVDGEVRSGCCQVTSNGTDLLGGARSDSSGLNITGGILQGAFYANNNPAVFSGVDLRYGSVSGASTISFSDSTLGSPDLPVTVSSVSGEVTLNNSQAFGDFSAPNWSTIRVNSPSSVTGTCLPNSTPANACRAPVVPSCLNERFSRSSLGEDWAVTSRNGSFGVPRIVGNRLRLTDNSGNVATGATVQRLIPARGNLVQIEFDYYAYNGSGADGIAVIFSDASVTPQPGGYGGSLGYAQLNGTSGFAGGWLGIALDEYGNFSNPSETRVGGPGLRRDSVSVRGSGSGTSGYRYLAGTAADLSPGIDVSGSSAGPGHRYRIRLDSRVNGRTLVSVERNSGSGFVTLIAPFDAQAASGQAALPENFFVTFTGSTGGSNNIHELDNLDFCADQMNPIGQQIDHFRFVYSADALTCNPQPVQIRACLDSACNSLFSDPVSLTLAPTTGWSATAPATLSGGNLLSFSGGVANVQLRSGAVGSVTLGVSGSLPATRPLSVPVCSSTGCRINYAESGFVFDIPTLIAARPQTGIRLRAVRSGNPGQACVPAFASVRRTLQFSAAYTDPGSGSRPVVVNGANIGSSPTALALDFDASGSAELNVRYDDAGLMLLSAQYDGSAATGDSGLRMLGSDPFVSKPYGLCLETDASCSVAGVDASCPAFSARAGDSFPLRIRPVGWQSDGEALTAAALCSGNPDTPNFRLAGIRLASSLLAPLGGDPGSLMPAAYDHALGGQNSVASALSEVGVFELSATPPAAGYFGESVGGGSSALVGRIVPAYLDAQGSAALQPACGTFSYQEQPIGFLQVPSLNVTGRNRQGAVTRNYDRGDFWRLALPALQAPSSQIAARPTLNARLQVDDSTLLGGSSDSLPGDGMRTFSWSGRTLRYQAAALPGSDDLPVNLQLEQRFGVATLTDADGVCHGAAGCTEASFLFGGSELRLGRLSLGNAHGSELQPLNLPLRLESWGTTGFQLEAGDSCSAPLLGSPALVAGSFSGNLQSGDTSLLASGPLAGIGQIQLSAPGAGNDGTVQVHHPALPAWLLYDWDGSGRQAPRGLASFGIYQGSPPLIFRRELYR